MDIKRLGVVFLAFVCSTVGINAQENAWEWQNPMPQANHLMGLDVVYRDTLVAVGGGGAIIRSTNRGLTWQWIPNELMTTGSLNGVDFVHNTGWTVGARGNILKSTDAGREWTAQSSGTTLDLAGVHAVNENRAWAVGPADIFPSQGLILGTSDGGVHWSSLKGTIETLHSTFFVDTTHGWIVGTGGKVFKTTDGGTTWSDTSLGQHATWRTVFFVTRAVGWVGGKNGLQCQIAKTTNAGATWLLTDVDLPSASISSLIFMDENNGWATSIREYPLTTYGKVYRTIDGGVTWNQMLALPYSPDHNAVRALDESTSCVVGEMGNVFSSSNAGASWENKRTSLGFSPNVVRFVDEHNGWAAGDEGYIARTTDGGEHWLAEHPGLTANYRAMYFLNRYIGWVASDNGFILNTIDGGVHWRILFGPSNLELDGVFFVDDQYGWSVGDSQLLRTTNGGVDWENLDALGSYVSVYFTSRTRGFISGDGPLGNGILKTTDGGTTWSEQSTRYVYSMSFPEPQVGYGVGDGRKIFKTTDAGDTWIQLGPPFSSELFEVQFLNTTNGYAVGFGGLIVKTTDGGITWTEVRTNLSRHLTSLSFVDNETGWACGWGETIIKTKTGGIVSVENEPFKPADVQSRGFLFQNYPNPFNPSTAIGYELPKAGHVSLKLFDLLGRGVATLENEQKVPGKYTVQWNAEDLPSGVYFARLSSNRSVQTIKLLLLK